ncbi:MAG: hypothetical protein VYC34_04845 [Planctomycetota bacterium]|nr:hypothetical protein [Planctomycetota bacterium]
MIERVVGIDFSAARTAGKSIWVARGLVEKDGVLIESCARLCDVDARATDLPGAMAALREVIAGAGDAVVGLDFPFGVAREMIDEATWEAFVEGFDGRWEDAGAFRRELFESTGGKELKRETDRAMSTPMSPINLRLHRQTFHGIRDVLRPLVMEGRARAGPMQARVEGLPLLVEICPASTLKRLGLRRPYKGRGAERAAARKALVKLVEGAEGLRFAGRSARAAAIENEGGDALDAALGCVGAARAARDSARFDRAVDGVGAIEGEVFC